jgi:hypothetical protein
MAALLRAWRLEQPVSARLLEKTVAKINGKQQRNACARRSHTKKTR